MDTLATHHDVDAEQDAARHRLEAYIAALVVAAPPLTDEQVSRLRELLGTAGCARNNAPTSQ